MSDAAELEQLRRWKAEAAEVLLGLQDLGRALGMDLGQNITGAEAVAAAKRLRVERDAAIAAIYSHRCPDPDRGPE